jgi:hypothetical protein
MRSFIICTHPQILVSYLAFERLARFPQGGVGQTQAWTPTYVSILRVPQMI